MYININNIIYTCCLVVFLFQIFVLALSTILDTLQFNKTNILRHLYIKSPIINLIYDFSVCVFFVYNAIYVYNSNIHYIFKIILIILNLSMPFILLYPILSIYNLYLFMKFNNPPFIDNLNDVFQENIELESKYHSHIKKELDIIYNSENNIECIAKNNPNFRIGNNIKDKCWRALYIKILDDFKIPNLKQKCPVLYDIINKPYISNAFLSILDGHVDIPEHRGYYKGYYRYHLGYIIPEYNNTRPYIVCGGTKYEWKEGKGVLFDDMYNHYVRNDTPYKRVVLYIDVVRPELRSSLMEKYFRKLISKNFFIKLLDSSQHKQNAIRQK